MQTDTITQTTEAGRLIASLFAAFQCGDVDTFINHVAETAPWCGTMAPALPYSGRLNGRAGARTFFERMLGDMQPERLEFDRWVCSGEDVVAIGVWSGTMRATGKRYDSALALYFRVRGGKIIEFRGHEDTAVTVAALKP